MSILIKPTKIKKGFYLLIPKIIADLTKVKDSTKFILEIKNGIHGKKIIQYILPALAITISFFAFWSIERAVRIPAASDWLESTSSFAASA